MRLRVELARRMERCRAVAGGAVEDRRYVAGKGEGDEVLGVEHLQFRRTGQDRRRRQGQRVVERQPRAVVAEEVLRRRNEFRVDVADREVGEEVEFGERLDVDLGERVEFLGAQLAVAVRVEIEGCIGGECLVELPDVANGGDPALGVEDDFRPGIDENVRMRHCPVDAGDGEKQEQCGGEEAMDCGQRLMCPRAVMSPPSAAKSRLPAAQRRFNRAAAAPPQ
jgi:hypothetical protein